MAKKSRMLPFTMLLVILLSTTEVHSQTKTCRQRPMDIVFILDGSRSVRPNNFKIVQDAVQRMVDGFETIGPDDTQIGLIQYSSRVRQEFPLNRYYTKESVKQAINGIRYLERGTMTGEALKYLVTRTMTKEEGARMDPEVLKVGVVITDGRSQDRTVPMWAQTAKDAGIVLFAIGIGRRISDKDLLLIASEPKKDHKFYAKNFEAFRNIRVMLTEEICVKKAPVPQDLSFSEITHTSMKVKWTLDDPERADDVKNYVVVYYKSDGLGAQMTMETTDPEAVLESLEPDTQYTVLVSAVTDIDFSPSVEGKETTLSLGETDLTLSDPTLTTLTARWQPAGGDLLSSYSLRATKLADGAGVSPDENQLIELGPDTHEHVLRGLEPGTRYEARVTPMYGKLKGGPGRDTESTKSPTPPDVDIVKTTLSTADVMWTNSGISPQSYTVSYCPTERPEDKKMFDIEDISTKLTDLEPGTEYKVEVVGNLFDDDKLFKTPPGSDVDTTKSLHPPPVRALERSLTSAVVEWGEVADLPADHFLVSYNPVGVPGVQTIKLDGDVTQTTLRSLEHDTEYEVSVVGVVLEDDKVFTSSPGRDTFTLGAFNPPAVQIPQTTETTLDAVWRDDLVRADDYVLAIERVDGIGDPKPPVTVDGKVSSKTFPDLTPGTEYKVSVITQVLDDGTVIESGPGSAIGITKPAPPENLTVTDSKPTSLTVTFDPSEGGSDWYEAKCVARGADPNEFKTIRVEKSDLTFTCEGLNPGVEYDIYIITVFRRLTSEPAKISSETFVGPPINFDLSEPTTYTILATWEPPEFVENVSKYSLTYQSLQHGTVESVTIPGTETRFLLDRLHPDTMYQGSIRAILDAHVTPGAYDTETTLPDVISLRVTDVGYTNISVEWPRSKVPHVVSYVLTYVPQPEDEFSEDTFHLTESVTLGSDETAYVIMNVMPATIYDITIQSVYPQEQRSNVARDTAVTLAPPPGLITFSNITTMSFIMHWEKPAYEAKPTGYSISYIPMGEEAYVEIEVPSGEVLDSEITGLKPDTEYNVSVVANYHYGIVSEPTHGKESTIAEPLDYTGQCGCRTYVDTQNAIESTLASLVAQISRLNSKIEQLESASFSIGGVEGVNRRSKRGPE